MEQGTPCQIGDLTTLASVPVTTWATSTDPARGWFAFDMAGWLMALTPSVGCSERR
jgi:hypothetical protein